MTVLYKNAPIYIGDISGLDFVLNDMGLKKEDVIIEHTKEEQKTHFKNALKLGKVSEDGKIWLNEDLLVVFGAKISATESLGLSKMLWKNTQKEVIELTLDEAKEYLKQGIKAIDAAYFGKTLFDE